MNKLFPFLLFYFCQLANSQKRECFCSQKYTLSTDSPIVDLGVDLEPLHVDDARDTCDFKCARTCNENIRELIGGDKQIVTLLGWEKMCEDVAPDRSVIKDGIKLVSDSDLDLCFNDRNILEDNICCVHCDCKLAYYQANEEIPSLVGGSVEHLIIEKDFTEDIFQTFNEARRAFKCNHIEHDKVCERSCRREIAAITEYQSINDRLDENRFDIIQNRAESNRICEKLFPDQVINSPGINLVMRMETGPRDVSLHKDVHLGNLCCRRTCECEIIYKNVNLTLNRTEMRIDLTYKLPTRPTSYYCDQESRECIDDCKIAAGEQLRNQMIQKQDISALDIDVFANFDTARRACIIYRKDTKKNEGIYIYLRYSTGNSYMKKLYPYSQTMYLGHVCCETYFNIDLFPFNKCKAWNIGDIPDTIEPIPA